MRKFAYRAVCASLCALVSSFAITTFSIRQLEQFQTELTPDFFFADSVTELSALSARMANSPLSETPLIAASFTLAQQGDNETSQSLLFEAIRRNPRSEPARSWQIQSNLELENYEEVISGLDALTRLYPDRSAQYYDALHDMAMMKESSSSVMASLEKDPLWGKAVLRRMNQGPKNATLRHRANEANSVDTAHYIQQLVNEKNFALAFSIWLDALPEEQLTALRWPFNSTFQELSAPAPFNWRLSENEIEFVPYEGASVTYFGRSTPVLLEQILPLGSGAYSFSALMSGELRANGGKLRWTIECADSERVLASMIAGPLYDQAALFDVSYEVPEENCDFQRLSLRGEPGEFTFWARARIEEVQISEAGHEAAIR